MFEVLNSKFINEYSESKSICDKDFICCSEQKSPFWPKSRNSDCLILHFCASMNFADSLLNMENAKKSLN